MDHRCPTYQLHLPPKTRRGDPKSPLQRNAGKFREIQGFLLNNIEMPRKRPIQGTPGVSFWGSQIGIWDDSPGRMTTAKVDMLGPRSNRRCFLNGVFRVVCSEGGQDPEGQKEPKCFKTLVFSGIHCPSERVFRCRKPR